MEGKQANTSVKQAEQDRHRRKSYGSGRKTSQYFRKADWARMLSEDKFTEVEGKQANTSVKPTGQECCQRINLRKWKEKKPILP